MLILYLNQPFCGGSIISTTKILTAAHCAYKVNKNILSIRVGSSTSYEGGQIYKISNVNVHPQYVHGKMVNDLAVLNLTNPLKLSPSVAIIEIDRTMSRLPDGIQVEATGWGRTCDLNFNPNCNISSTLLSVKLPVIANNRCGKLYKKYEHSFQIKPSMICAGLSIGGKDTCQGDSGGL